MDPNAGSFIRRDGINWTSVTAFAVFHVGAVVQFAFGGLPFFLWGFSSA